MFSYNLVTFEHNSGADTRKLLTQFLSGILSGILSITLIIIEIRIKRREGKSGNNAVSRFNISYGNSPSGDTA